MIPLILNYPTVRIEILILHNHAFTRLLPDNMTLIVENPYIIFLLWVINIVIRLTKRGNFVPLFLIFDLFDDAIITLG